MRLPAYRRLLAAYTFNELAWGLGPLALALLVYRRTGSAIGATAFFLCSQFFPALLSPLVVARVERISARRLLPLLYSLEGVVYLVLAWITHHFAVVPVLALVLVDGVIALTARPVARATTVAVTAPAGVLREGNALTNIAFSICLMAGPALGGAIVATGGTTAALVANASVFAVIALTVASYAGLPKPVADGAGPAGRVRAAIAHARAEPRIRALLALQAVGALFFSMSIPVEVVYTQHTLHAGAGGYGLLLAMWGTGAIAGSAVYARLHGLSAQKLISASSALLGAGFLIMTAAPSLAVALAGAIVAGAGNGIESVAARTALQEEVDAGWMAMMMSLMDSIMQAVPGVGILLGGGVTAVAGPRIALAVGGVASLAITVAAWVLLSPRAMRGARVADVTHPDTPRLARPLEAPRPGGAGPSG